MREREAQYKSVTMRLGFTMLFFTGIFLIKSVVFSLFENAFAARGLVGNIIYELLSGMLYALSFVLPVFFFSLISKNKPKAKIYFERNLPRETPQYIFAGLALILAAAFLNAELVDIFDYSFFTDAVYVSGSETANYEWVLLFFTDAIVPAFVEELLFRGLVLTNLLPYGRTTAIVGSAVLFGVMHQNAGQLLYATVAGLFLGYVYVKTKSIYCGVLLHFVNNFYSSVQSAWAERLAVPSANLIITITEFFIFGVGLLSLVWLILQHKKEQSKIYETGAFGVEIPPDPDFAEIEISAKRRVQLFFTPPMIAFFVISFLEMFMLLGLASLVGAFV